MTRKTERAAFSRTLTKMLEEAGMEDVSFAGTVQPRDERLVQLVWQYIINGEVRLKNNELLKATSREWITALKWLFSQIDGAPKSPPESGGIMTIEWVDPFAGEGHGDGDSDVKEKP